ncbi:MAG: hypothetical protein HY763_04850 [Planctomycetes bacterium]|nr:hypothetical protein [Planctomycetota bacterium]
MSRGTRYCLRTAMACCLALAPALATERAEDDAPPAPQPTPTQSPDPAPPPTPEPGSAAEPAPPTPATPAPHGAADAPRDAAAVEALPLPDAQLLPLEPAVDDLTYQRSIATRAAELAQQAEAAKDPAAQVDLLLAAANQILAFEVEPACSRKFYGLAELPSGNAAAIDAVARADALLARAEGLLSAARGAGGEPPEWVAAGARRLEVLRPFAQGVREFLTPSESADAARSARQAASALSMLMEDANETVAAAATFWHAVLRARDGDPSPAVSVLPLALSEVRRKSLPFAYFCRLLRCRLLAERGSHALSLAMLTQIEERCDRWLASGPDRAAGLRAVTWLELQALREWHQRLSTEPDAQAKTWCAERFQTLAGDRFKEGERTLLRLSPAVPLVAVAGEAAGAADRPKEGKSSEGEDGDEPEQR